MLYSVLSTPRNSITFAFHELLLLLPVVLISFFHLDCVFRALRALYFLLKDGRIARVIEEFFNQDSSRFRYTRYTVVSTRMLVTYYRDRWRAGVDF